MVKRKLDAGPVDVDVSIDVDYLKKQFDRFRDEFSGMRDKLSGTATEALDELSAYFDKNKFQAGVSAMGSEFDQLAGKLKGSSKDAVHRIEREVGERPIAGLAIAFGIGLLAAQFFRRP
ncbi:MAG: hypothetical protein POH28_08540 [Acidocella sp.]|nr:hypothetical protein [Acidocella sp.]